MLEDHLADLQNGATPHAKGVALETLVCELFETIPGIKVYERRVVDYHVSEEIDIWIANNGSLPFLPYMFPLECKNWTKTVDAQAVVSFEDKVAPAGAGVLVATNGISGQNIDDPTHANHKIYMARSRRRQILVLTEPDLAAIMTVDDLVTTLQDRYSRLLAFGNQF